MTATRPIAQSYSPRHPSHFQMEYFLDTAATATANRFKVGTAVCSDGAPSPTLLDLHRAQSWICTTIFSSLRKRQSAATRSVLAKEPKKQRNLYASQPTASSSLLSYCLQSDRF